MPATPCSWLFGGDDGDDGDDVSSPYSFSPVFSPALRFGIVTIVTIVTASRRCVPEQSPSSALFPSPRDIDVQVGST